MKKISLKRILACITLLCFTVPSFSYASAHDKPHHLINRRDGQYEKWIFKDFNVSFLSPTNKNNAIYNTEEIDLDAGMSELTHVTSITHSEESVKVTASNKVFNKTTHTEKNSEKTTVNVKNNYQDENQFHSEIVTAYESSEEDTVENVNEHTTSQTISREFHFDPEMKKQGYTHLNIYTCVVHYKGRLLRFERQLIRNNRKRHWFLGKKHDHWEKVRDMSDGLVEGTQPVKIFYACYSKTPLTKSWTSTKKSNFFIPDELKNITLKSPIRKPSIPQPPSRRPQNFPNLPLLPPHPHVRKPRLPEPPSSKLVHHPKLLPCPPHPQFAE